MHIQPDNYYISIQSYPELLLHGLLNHEASFQLEFDWDGKTNSLEDQAVRPIFNDIELHNNNWSEVISRLQMSDLYPDLFYAAFGTDEIDEIDSKVKPELNNLLKDLSSAEEEACDSCAI